jgi:Trk K+ transport system NAD-binding subunit
MRLIPAEFAVLFAEHGVRRNLSILAKFLLALALLAFVFSILFHVLMEMEGRQYSWFTGFYWTLTVMSTLGFGDITFHSDLGRAFSMVVLISGTLFLLILFPFILIQFFWMPWMEAQAAQRAPRELSADTRNHVILTHYDEVTAAFIERLTSHHVDYCLVVPERQEALRLHEMGLRVMIGDLDDPDTYRRARADQAALVATTCNDFANSHVAFTVCDESPDVPIVSTADDPASVDLLELAGCSHVLELSELMGQSLARRTLGGDAMTHLIGEFGRLCIAEATAARTPIVGKTLRDSNLRGMTGLSVVGMWERGTFAVASPDSEITASTVLVLAGTREQLFRYDELFVIYNVSAAPVLILGGGRVGQSTGRALAEREIDYRIVEKDASVIRDSAKYVIGNAAEIEVLQAAGIMETPTVIVTTNDDDLNVYLTIYCRRLRPDVQIITRASLERNLGTFHRAGSDFVMSYASMGANTMMNLLKRSEILMLAVGLDLFKLAMPPTLAGKTIAQCSVRERTGAHIAAILRGEDMEINPDPATELPADAELVLIGSIEAEDRFLEIYS